ncbi:MORN repeat-containing protein 5 [Papilio xuthus]|uniref:MORN repeat-containing protein 5 n=1 Tax=Papilio xuthus TaxID=66420 RepID=A0A194PM63_PAPXU|nr:MORN repeat-containing protein 5 [Papilio xuthus]
MSSDKGRGSSVAEEKRPSMWEELMRKFIEEHKVECKAVSVDIPRVTRSAKEFPTGSRYEGTWDVLGMSGYGLYTFPNGVIYEGEFEDGMFHGRGELRYPCGAVLYGKWTRGVLGEKTLAFADGLEYDEDLWPYCVMPDRRFTIEHNKGLKPAGESYTTPDQPPREIPKGFYDTGDGFYDPDTKVVYKVDDPTSIVRYPCEVEQTWILENCRTNPESTVGPREDLYEEWVLPMIYVPTMQSSMSMSMASFSYRYSTDYGHDSDSDRYRGHVWFFGEKSLQDVTAKPSVRFASASAKE